MLAALFSFAIAAALVFHLRSMWIEKRDKSEQERSAAIEVIASVLENSWEAPDEAVGVLTWNGVRLGEHAQIRTIVDTLPTRKLPALWLSVTINEKVAVGAILDMMMRPGSATTFSNFDQLPETIATPSGFPAEAVIRTNVADGQLPFESVAAHLDIFREGRAKELLITPNGVRIVWLLAEADRARYGVFRQAEFGGTGLDTALLERLLTACSRLRAVINANAIKAAA
jgi:hypothetical protein